MLRPSPAAYARAPSPSPSHVRTAAAPSARSPRVRRRTRARATAISLRRFMPALAALAALLLPLTRPSPAAAQPSPPPPPVRGALWVEAEAARPGETVRVGVQLTIAPGWHIYGPQPGDAGLATQLDLSATGAQFGPAQFPPATTFAENDQVKTFGYAKGVTLVRAMQVDAAATGELPLRAQVKYLACNITCTPGQLVLERRVPLAAEAAAAGPEARAAFAAFDAALRAPPAALEASLGARGLLELLVAAFVGGLLLNLMPCVLPVLALKATSLVQLGREDARARRHAWAYLVGVVGALQLLAAVVLVARSLGHAVGWGFQFQEPLFVAAVAVALVVFAANCLGAFTLTPQVSGLAAAHDRAHGRWRGVLEGALAVLVATPCSTPFLGGAVALALGAGGALVPAVFAAVGVGLAAPYLALVYVPGARRLLPRPGAWMLGLKAALGYALLASAAWLAWVLGRAQGIDAVAALLMLALVAAAGAHLLGVVLERLPQAGAAGLGCLLALLVGLGGELSPWLAAGELEAAGAQGAGGQEGEQAFNDASLQRAMEAGRPVFVDFTADWCVTCKYNERHVLADTKVRRVFAERHVVVLKADFTRRDEAISQVLATHGRAGVPMYLLYRPGNPTPTLLPEVLTVATVLRALQGG